MKLITQQSTGTLGDLEAGKETSYLVQVQDYYGNPTSIPEPRYLTMGMKKDGKARHRPKF
jgi:hypothetical protein